MMDQMNFKDAINFSANALSLGSTSKFNRQRQMLFTMPDVTKDQLEKAGDFVPQQHYLRVRQAMIDKHAEKVRASMDTPFDELYAKEKQLVSDIIRT